MMVRLKDICDVDWGDTNLTKQAYVENGKYLGVSAGGCDGRMDYYDFEAYTPVISAIGANCGKMFLPEEPFVAIKNTITLKPHKDILGKYIFYALISNKIPHRGGGQPFISKTDTEEYMIICPSLEEQVRIVTIFDKVCKIIDMHHNQLSKLDELVKSRFIELFGLPVSNSKGWNTEKMREVAPAANYSGGFEDTVWLLNLDMVEAKTGRILDYLYVNEEEVGNSTCTFDTTNVLYSKLRPYLNKVVIPDRCGYATSELIPLKPNPMKLERAYLAFMLRSDEFVNMINEKVAGAKMPRVSMSDFREFDVPVPPMELQQQFVAFVEQTDKSKFEIKKSLAKLEILKKSLMQQYFG